MVIFAPGTKVDPLLNGNTPVSGSPSYSTIRARGMRLACHHVSIETSRSVSIAVPFAVSVQVSGSPVWRAGDGAVTNWVPTAAGTAAWCPAPGRENHQGRYGRRPRDNI